jgi:ribulose-phosphate 3-epimerase
LLKIKQLKQLIKEKQSSALIEVDGGVTLENAASIIQAGADVLVAGNTVFASTSPIDTIKQLKSIC